MSDSLNSGIQKIYMFLGQNDWKTGADKKADGIITKAEMRQYLLIDNHDAVFDNWSGEDKSSETDIFNAFWRKWDSNVSGICAGSKSVRNQNALDANEIARLAEKIKIFEEVNKVLEDLDFGNVPSDLNCTQADWENEVKSEFSQIVNELIESGKLKEGEIENRKDEILNLAKSRATARLYANQYKDDTAIKNLLDKYDYDITTDATLRTIINNYIQTLKGGENDIIANVEKIIKGYLATAGVGDGNVNDVTSYYKTSGANMNNLQKAVLTAKFEEYLNEEFLSNTFTNYADYKSDYQSAVSDFIKKEKIAKNNQYSKFAELNKISKEDLQAEFKDYAAQRKIGVKASDNPGSTNDSGLPAAFWNTIKIPSNMVTGTEYELGTLDSTVTISGETKDVTKITCDNRIVTVDGNKISVKSDTGFSGKITIKVTVDGQEYSKEFTINIKAPEAKKEISWSEMTQKYTTYISQQNTENGTVPLTTMSLKDMYDGQVLIGLSDMSQSSTWQDTNDIDTLKNSAISNLSKFLDIVKSSCITNGYDENALSTAHSKVLALYTVAFDTASQNRQKDQEEADLRFVFNTNDAGDGEAYSFHYARYRKNSTLDGIFEQARNNSSSNNQLGLVICENRQGDDHWKVMVNARVVMDLFQKFYEQALGA